MFHVKHLRWNIGGFITEQKQINHQNAIEIDQASLSEEKQRRLFVVNGNVSRETSTDDDGNDTETVTYKLNGSDLDETTFTTFYNKLINMTAQKRLTDKYEPDGDAELTATFTEEDGDTQKVAYYSYDTNYYAAVVDNKVYLVNKMNVKELFTAFESVVGTEEDSSDKTDSDEATTDDTKSDSTDMPGESIEESDDSTSETAGITNDSDTPEEENTDSQETDSTEE